ncbi:unnamed protein product [Clonostachys chloroleuca]|uniref:Heterokaryon incompatibility domain-containing protein n=1 Tax=Clonostachys chloroleuca TaxID=1926264 RepID=A0AA35LXR2_9HYPO|nr:unnamed protein product [Clonostachys chloroleuca]
MESSSHLAMDVVLPAFEFQPFEYTDISSNEIRLLSFVERHGQPESYKLGSIPLIECTLETVDFYTSPAYEVLSYAPGNPLSVQPDSNDEYGDACKWPVAVNGRLLYVSRNLYEGLSRVRQLRHNSNVTADEETRYKHDKTRLIKAAEQGMLDEVLDCLRSGAHLYAKDEFGKTALHYAAENGRLEMVRSLLEHGASLDDLDKSHRTPFACCVQQRRGEYEEVAALLLSWKGEDRGDPARKMGDPLWIEALCVDQSNVEERNVQAAMMTQILSQARMVIGWLGVDDATTSTAYKLMMECDSIRPSIVYYLQYKWDTGVDQEMEIDSESDTSLLSTREVQAIMTLLERSWFRQTGASQELTMAKDVALYCGPYTFSWTDASMLLRIIKSSDNAVQKRKLASITAESQSSALTLRGKRTQSWTNLVEDNVRPHKRVSLQKFQTS